MVYPDSHTASFFNYPVFISVFMRSVFLCGAQSCAGAGSAAVVSAVTRRTLCNFAVKQLMLPFDPVSYTHLFGRNDLDLPWERLDKVELLKSYL